MQHTTELSDARAIPRGARPRWPLPIVLVHWGTVGLIALSVALIYGREAVGGRALREGLLNGHRWAGVLIWAVACARLALRLSTSAPTERRPAEGRFVTWAATATHAALYALLLAVPLLGWALSSARGQSVGVLGWHLPMPLDRDPDVADDLATAHTVAALTLLGLTLLHALAAAWHHFVRRDGVLASMAIAREKTPTFEAPQPGLPSPPPAELT